MKKKLYLLVIFGDVEPCLKGPYKTDEDRLEVARRIRQVSDKDGVFRLNTDSKGKPVVGPFSGGEIEGD
jgi:hypothetical protein